MPAQYQNTADFISLITVLCFSFCISVLSLWFRKADKLPQLLGCSFIPVLVFSVISFLFFGSIFSSILFLSTEPLLLLLFALVLASDRFRPNGSFVKPVLILVPAAILIILAAIAAKSDALTAGSFFTSLSVAGSVAVLYFLKSKKNDLNMIFWAILPFLASYLIGYYIRTGIFSYMSPLLKLAAYSLMIAYFYGAFYKAGFAKAEESEKKLAAINRSIDFEVKRRMLEVEKVNQALINKAKTDPMSKVLNKQALLDSIDNLINSRAGYEFSIIMFDIDNFKEINDTLGHVTGDKCIKALAYAARNNIRDIDIVGRYGGDEFIIILPGVAASQAMMIAERFRQKVVASISPHFTVSLGVASYPADGTDTQSLIEAADEGLYRSKQRGRNLVSHRSFQ